MQKVGYSLIDSENKEVQYWGYILGQDVGFPDIVIMPDGSIVYSPPFNEDIGGYKIVERWIEANTELSNLISGETIAYDGEKTVVTYAYRDPNYDELLAYSASKRYNKEISGVMIGNNFVYTDRQSQAMITGITTLMQLNPNTVINFKTANGFIQANSVVIAEIASGVANHIQTCFTIEADVSANVSSYTITTFDQVDAAYV